MSDLANGNYGLVKMSRSNGKVYEVYEHSANAETFLNAVRGKYATYDVSGTSNTFEGTTVRTCVTMIFQVWDESYVVNPHVLEQIIADPDLHDFHNVRRWLYAANPADAPSGYGWALIDAQPEAGSGDDTEYTSQVWDDAEAVIGVSRRVLLWGPPGTGKTYAASRYNTGGRPTYSITMTEETPMFELRGTYMPNEEGGVSWLDGIGTNAWQDGARLVINEIDRAGADSQSYMYALLDDPEFAQVTLPKFPQVTLTPNATFDVVATMNGHPEDLPEALRDRFPTSIRIDEVHPKALAKLSPGLRTIAAKTIVQPPSTRIGFRRWLEFDNLVSNKHMKVDQAARVTLGSGISDEMLKAIQIASV